LVARRVYSPLVSPAKLAFPPSDDQPPTGGDGGASAAALTAQPCLSPEEALAYVACEAGGPTPEVVQPHLDQCALCRVVVAEAARAATVEELTGAATLRTLAEGELIGGRYEIRRFLARGGMGEVYEAADTVLGEVVALKTLLPTVLDDERAVARLFDEVRLARKVTHPNVCRILEVGLHRKPGAQELAVPFLTMDFLTGETLAARLARRGPLPQHDVRRLLREMVAGLAAVHRAGIVHRDFKAENVFLVDDGNGGERAVVMDFGLARHVRGLPSGGSAGGSIAGTADYMAPEQLEGKAPTPAFDVYALGVVLFELLTGHKPFAGQSPLVAAVARLRTTPPGPSALVPELEGAWDAVVHRCLQVDPQRRFPHVEEIPIALEALRAHRRPRRWRWIAGAVALVLAALAAFFAAGRLRGEAGAARPAPPSTGQAP
jgi:hypothetical protein